MPRLTQPQKGEGLKSGVRQLIFGRDELVRGSKAIMECDKAKMIKKVQIVRTPINKAINAIIKVGTLTGANYDKLYHLYAILVLDDNTHLVLEKNSSISIKGFKKMKKEAEVKDIPVRTPVTLAQAFNNIIKGYKDSREMFGYHFQFNNCQRFLTTFLYKNTQYFKLDPLVKKFINQDVTQIFKNAGLLKKLINKVTDTANNASVLIGSGQKIKRKRL